MSFREQMQFALNKKLEHCTSTLMCTFLIKGHPGCLVVHVSVLVQVAKENQTLSDSIDTDVLALVTKSECAVPEDIHLQHPFMASL